MQGVIVANKSFLNGTPELFFCSNRAPVYNSFNSVGERHDLSIGEDTVDPKLLELVDCVWWCAIVLKPAINAQKTSGMSQANWEVLRSKILRKCLPVTVQSIENLKREVHKFVSRVQMKSCAGKPLENVNCCAFLKRIIS
jgi:hypothetical protein